MGAIKEFVARLKATSEEEQERAIYRIVEGRSETVIDLNTNQLLEGKDSEGGFITPPYRSKLYAELKLSLNPKGVVDLRLTGDFENSFFIRTKGWPMSIWANDSKTKELVKKYGETIFGLTKQSKGTLAEDIKPDTQTYYRKVLLIR
jgi:hypothetical protein